MLVRYVGVAALLVIALVFGGYVLLVREDAHPVRNRASLPRSRPTPLEPRCMISSRGSDGLGHQLEAKLSCMTVALELGFEYVHTPFAGPPAPFESLFNLGTLHPLKGNRTEKWREPLPRVGRCGEESWFDKRARDCVPGVVYTGDNCWPEYYCHTLRSERGRRLWYDHVQPRVRAAFTGNLTGAAAARGNVTTVVVHIRGGDVAHMVVPHRYYLQAMDFLRQRMTPPLQFLIHTNAVGKLPASFARADVTIRHSPQHRTIESIGREDETRRLIADFLTADALVLSRSSLSYSLAMVANTSLVIYPACEHDRQALALLGWLPRAC